MVADIGRYGCRYQQPATTSRALQAPQSRGYTVKLVYSHSRNARINRGTRQQDNENAKNKKTLLQGVVGGFEALQVYRQAIPPIVGQKVNKDSHRVASLAHLIYTHINIHIKIPHAGNLFNSHAGIHVHVCVCVCVHVSFWVSGCLRVLKCVSLFVRSRAVNRDLLSLFLALSLSLSFSRALYLSLSLISLSEFVWVAFLANAVSFSPTFTFLIQGNTEEKLQNFKGRVSNRRDKMRDVTR